MLLRASLALAAATLFVACNDNTPFFGCPLGQTLAPDGRCVDIDPPDTGGGDTAGNDVESDASDAGPDDADTVTPGDADTGAPDTDDAGEDTEETGPDVPPDTVDADTAPDTADADDTSPDTEPDVAQDIRPDTPGDTRICEPNARRCGDAGVALVCDESGTREDEVFCGTSQVCDDGRCVTQACSPGAVRACFDGDTRAFEEVCDDRGLAFEERACETGTFCWEDRCTRACVPDERYCDGDTAVVCQGDYAERQECEACEAGACLDPCAAPSSELGCDFFAVDLDNYDVGGVDDGESIGVLVSNPGPGSASVVVRDPDGDTVTTASIAAGEGVSLELPALGVASTSLGTNAYRITSTAPVSVQQLNRWSGDKVTADGSLLLPTQVAGTHYRVLGWDDHGEALGSYLTIVATSETPTRVTVWPSVATESATGVPAIAAGGSRFFDLTEGQVLSLGTVNEGESLAGTRIIASHPVQVFAGTECSRVPADVPYCDHLEEQLVPVREWGTIYVAAKLLPRGEEPDVYRIVASEDGTVVTSSPAIAGLESTTLDAGEWTDVVTAESFVIRASAPIAVGQFMVSSTYPGPPSCDPGDIFGTADDCAIPSQPECDGGVGDPAFAMLIPTTHGRTSGTWVAPEDYDAHQVTIVVPTGAVVTLDGATLGSSDRVALGDYRLYRLEVEEGPHRVTSTEPMQAYAYGHTCDGSYLFPIARAAGE